MKFKIETEQEEDGRWLAEIHELPGCRAYGDTPDTARAGVETLGLRVLADRLEHGELSPLALSVAFAWAASGARRRSSGC